MGKKRLRHYLSDEVLCHGSPEAPIVSEFSRPLVFLEAYKHNNPPSSAELYMSAAQVAWLQGELYATSAPSGRSTSLTYADLQPDAAKAIKLRQFAATRKVCFQGDTARFRLRSGDGTAAKAAAKLSLAQANAIVRSPAAEPSNLDPHMRPNQAPLRTLKPAPTSYVSLTRAERAVRAAAAREEALAAHIAAQKAALPSWRRFYRNLERLGGVALSCDVECWTEDADVLLELGLAWLTWTPTGDGKTTARDGGARHFSTRFLRRYVFRAEYSSSHRGDPTVSQRGAQARNQGHTRRTGISLLTGSSGLTKENQDYTLGISETLPQRQISRILQSTIKELSKQGPLVLVFHDASAETRYFQKLDVDPTFYHTRPPPAYCDTTMVRWPATSQGYDSDDSSQAMIVISDTQNLYCGWSEPPVKQINLGKACGILGLHDIDPNKLHNAGNDAFATLRVWELLIDMQENARQSVSVQASKVEAPLIPAAAVTDNVTCAVGDLIQF